MFREVNLLRTRDVTVEYSVMGTGSLSSYFMVDIQTVMKNLVIRDC